MPTQLASDYAAQAPGNPRKVYDAPIYDGSNIGRFANDAGLLPGLRLLVELSNKVAYPAGFEWSAVEAEAEQHCNAKFQCAGPTAMVLVATRDIPLGGSQSQEIYISYGIQRYWLSCIASKIPEWGLENPMVQALLWCVKSEQSNWGPSLRAKCLDDIADVHPGIAHHHHFPCPWPELLQDTPRPRRTRSRSRT